MASAGRILIIPKGEYSSTTAYEPLDMVLYNGDSWLCKQNVTGTEPSDDNSEYWYRVTKQDEEFKRNTENALKNALYITWFDEANGELYTQSADYV